MGALDAMKMARSRQEPGDIYVLAHGKRLGVDLSVWLYQLVGFINPEEGRDFHWAARILVNRAIRLSRRGVTMVIVPTAL